MVGVSRISGEVFALRRTSPTTEKISYFFQLLAGVNLVLFLFNLLPIYPLDGGHIAGALYEKARATVARLRGRPDPGPFDIARLMPVAYSGRRAVPGPVGTAVHRRHRQPDHPGLTGRAGQVTAGVPGDVARDGDTGRMAIPVGLGMPAAPPPVLAPRRKTRQLEVGGVGVGSDFPVSVQSMTTTKTADINATLQQIAELTASGCQIVRVAVPDTDDAEALPIIAKKSQIPVIADIHFQPRYVFAAIDAGCAAVRVNPGNIKKFDDKVGEIARAAKDAGIPIRIGVNAGSLDKRLLAKYGKATPEALVESALWECSLFEEHDFRDIKISVKHNDPVIMVRAYELLAAQCDYPLHLGVTEAGPAFQGTIKSAVAFGALLSPGHRRHDPRLPLRPAGGGGQGRQPDPRVAQPAPARPGDRQLPVVRARAGRRLQAGRGGHRRARGHGGAAARRRHGLRRERPRRGPRGRPRGRVGQRQGADLRQGRGRQDRAGVADRGDPHRGGHAHRRPSTSTPGSRPAPRSSASADPGRPVLRTPTARVLDEADEAAVHRLLATDPVAACVLAGRVEAAGTAAARSAPRCGASGRAAPWTRSAWRGPT